jgi:hypothetical protein
LGVSADEYGAGGRDELYFATGINGASNGTSFGAAGRESGTAGRCDVGELGRGSEAGETALRSEFSDDEAPDSSGLSFDIEPTLSPNRTNLPLSPWGVL